LKPAFNPIFDFYFTGRKTMSGIGLTLIIMGSGSFLLPLFGLQFALLNLLGSARPVVALVLIVAGGA